MLTDTRTQALEAAPEPLRALTVRVEAELLAEVRQLSRQEDRPMTQMARVLLREALAARQASARQLAP